MGRLLRTLISLRSLGACSELRLRCPLPWLCSEGVVCKQIMGEKFSVIRTQSNPLSMENFPYHKAANRDSPPIILFSMHLLQQQILFIYHEYPIDKTLDLN